MPGILLLGGRGRSTWIVANAIKRIRPDLKVIVENPPSRWKMLRYRMRKLGLVTAFGQALFILYARLVAKRHESRIRELLAEARLDDTPWPSGHFHHVQNMNSRDAIELIKQVSPDLVVVNGTRILRKRTLSALNCPAINIHVGITPCYRGVHGGYWALVNDDPENFGTTLHFIDEGVDTGRIITQVRTCPSEEDTFFTYPVLQLTSIVPILLDYIEGKELPSYEKASCSSRQWYHPTIWEYFKTGLVKNIW